MLRSCSLRRMFAQATTKENLAVIFSGRRFMSLSGRQLWRKEHLEAPQGGATIPENVPVRQRRIIYRSKQRGWLELDILMGSWATKNVPKMQDDRLISQIEHLLEADTPNVLRWILGQETPPAQYQTEIMKSLQAYASGDGHVNDR